MEFYTNKLENGLTVYANRMLSTHSVTISLYIRGGVNWESGKQKGITHLVEHLCFRRSDGHPQKEFYRQIESIGGFLRGTTYRDHMVFEISVHPSFFKQAAAIIRQLLLPNGWINEDIRKEKEVVLRQIECDYFSFEKAIDERYYNHERKLNPVMGSISRVRKLSKRELESWKNQLIRPENAALIMAGAISQPEMEEVINEFTALKNIAAPPVGYTLLQNMPRNFLNRSAGDDYIYHHEYSTTSVGLVFDLDASLITGFESDMLADMLSLGLGSRLLMLLREELGILHEIPTFWDFTDFGGNLCFTFEVESKHTDLLLRTLAKEFSLAKKELDPLAFEYTKTYYTMSKATFLEDNPVEYVRMLGERAFLDGGDFGTVESLIDWYRVITYEKLNITAQAVFHANNLSITLVTDMDEMNMRALRTQIAVIRKALQ